MDQAAHHLPLPFRASQDLNLTSYPQYRLYASLQQRDPQVFPWTSESDAAILGGIGRRCELRTWKLSAPSLSIQILAPAPHSSSCMFGMEWPVDLARNSIG